MDLGQFASPRSKLVRFFKKSRDRWKSKHHELKMTCKLLQNQTRAVEKSRASWRQRAVAAEQRLAELQQEADPLKIGFSR
jgi:chromosome segregation ATPase